MRSAAWRSSAGRAPRAYAAARYHKACLYRAEAWLAKMRRPRQRVVPAWHREAIRLRRRCYSIAMIAKSIGKSTPHVCTFLKGVGMTLPHGRRRVSSPRRASPWWPQAVALVAEGHSVPTVARTLGRTPPAIRYVLQHYDPARTLRGA